MEELYRFLAPEEVVEGAFENLWVQGRYGFTGCVTNRRMLFVGTTRRIGFEKERVIEIPLDAISNFEVEVRERDVKLFIAGVLLVGIGVLFSSLTVLIYQGAIALLAGMAQSLLTEAMTREGKLAADGNPRCRAALADIDDLPFLAIERKRLSTPPFTTNHGME